MQGTKRKCSEGTLAIQEFLRKTSSARSSKLCFTLNNLRLKDRIPSDPNSFQSAIYVCVFQCMHEDAIACRELLRALMPHVCTLNIENAVLVFATVFALPGLASCRLELVQRTLHTASTARYRKSNIATVFAFAVSLLRYIYDDKVDDIGIENIIETSFSSLSSSDVHDVFAACVPNRFEYTAEEYARYTRTLHVWECLKKPTIDFAKQPCCLRHIKQPLFLYYDCLLNMHDKLLFFGSSESYEAYISSASATHLANIVAGAIMTVLSLSDTLTSEEVDAAMRHDPFYTRDVIGVSCTNWAWDYFATIAKRFPDYTLEVLKRSAHCTFLGTAGTPEYTLNKTVLQDMTRWTETYSASRMLRWTFIDTVTTLSVLRFEEDDAVRKRRILGQ